MLPKTMTNLPPAITDYLKTWPIYLLPQHMLTHVAFRLARCTQPTVKAALIEAFVSYYRVDMGSAEQTLLSAYASFNEFFTRKLRSDARPLPSAATAVASPVDGAVSQLGKITNSTLMQAKGHAFSLQRLLGDDAELSARFAEGSFITLYLSPRDYHRIHMPVRGHLRKQIYVPGRLFAVNEASTRVVPELFARNERVITEFETEAGPLALIMVGALLVGSIETVWAGPITPAPDRSLQTTHYGPQGVDSITLLRGAELGRFNMGSTVILLFGKDRITWAPDLLPGVAVRMGQLLGTWR
jgi:phosphatidylserine decarboxylase